MLAEGAAGVVLDGGGGWVDSAVLGSGADAGGGGDPNETCVAVCRGLVKPPADGARGDSGVPVAGASGTGCVVSCGAALALMNVSEGSCTSWCADSGAKAGDVAEVGVSTVPMPWLGGVLLAWRGAGAEVEDMPGSACWLCAVAAGPSVASIRRCRCGDGNSRCARGCETGMGSAPEALKM